MAVVTKELEVSSKGENDIVDITGEVRKAVEDSRLRNGIVTVFVPGSTAAVTTMEFEPGLLEDFPNMMDRVAPRGLKYQHEKTWNDGNGRSHVKASLLGPGITVPFVGGKPVLGTWQQVVLVELDIRPRRRRLVLQMMGE